MGAGPSTPSVGVAGNILGDAPEVTTIETSTTEIKAPNTNEGQETKPDSEPGLGHDPKQKAATTPKPGKKVDALDGFIKKLLKKQKKKGGSSSDNPEEGSPMNPQDLAQFMKFSQPFLDTLKNLFNEKSKDHFADDQVNKANDTFDKLIKNGLDDLDPKNAAKKEAGQTGAEENDALDDKGALKDTLKDVFESDDFKKGLMAAATPSDDEEKDENEDKEEDEDQSLDDKIDEISNSLSEEANGIDPGPSTDLGSTDLPIPTPTK